MDGCKLPCHKWDHAISSNGLELVRFGFSILGLNMFLFRTLIYAVIVFYDTGHRKSMAGLQGFYIDDV